ncbi:MAG: hypothetical protein M3Z96_00670 [Pseudomonadota bacterium]|nr:hypothetical protein [Pseudomonadota bacterium]
MSYRVGATFAAGVVAIPIEPIPGLDVLYDIGVPILLIWLPRCDSVFGRVRHRPHGNVAASTAAGAS